MTNTVPYILLLPNLYFFLLSWLRLGRATSSEDHSNGGWPALFLLISPRTGTALGTHAQCCSESFAFSPFLLLKPQLFQPSIWPTQPFTSLFSSHPGHHWGLALSSRPSVLDDISIQGSDTDSTNLPFSYLPHMLQSLISVALATYLPSHTLDYFITSNCTTFEILISSVSQSDRYFCTFSLLQQFSHHVRNSCPVPSVHHTFISHHPLLSSPLSASTIHYGDAYWWTH